MDNKPLAPTPPALFHPIKVVSRLSTDVIACNVPEISSAIQYIRASRNRKLAVDEVVRHTGVSRRKLENLIADHLGTTLLQLIHREHVKLAQELLIETSLTIDQIAETCGLVSREQLTRIFSRITQISPAAYRNQHRVRQR